MIPHRLLILTLLALSSTAIAQTAPATRPSLSLNIRDFGATADGTTKDTAALQKALDTCAVAGGGEVLVPAGRYLIGSIQLGTRTLLRLEKDAVLIGSPDAADYPTMDIRWEGRWQPGRRALIYASNVDHTGIVGAGPTSRIEGNAAMAAPQNPRGSVVLEPINCTDIRWEDFSITQGGNWATHPTYCTDVIIKNLSIRGNRDGIDIDSSKNVRIENCTLDCGDDCISLKSGRGLDGARIGKPTEDVFITGCTMTGRNFACIGIGSETSAGVKNITIEKSKMTARTHAIYIKTRTGRAGVTENITGTELDILSGGFLKINLTTGGNTNTADDPIQGLAGYPVARNLTFSKIRLTNATVLVESTLVSPEKPIENLTLTDITGTTAKGISLLHVKNATLKNINVTGLTTPLLSTQDTTGTGLENATPLPTPKPPLK